MIKRTSHKNCLMILGVALIVMGCSSAVPAKRTDDVVVLKNGDRLTGEIKSLQAGELKFKSSYMAEAVRLDWSKVATLETRDRYLISLVDGQLFTDLFHLSLAGSGKAGNFTIGSGDSVKVAQMDVLRILPVETNFWHQLQGRVDLGLNFTSGNDQYSTELSTSVTYRKGDHSVTAAVDSAFSGQTQGSSTARNEFTLDYRKQISPKWYVGGLFDFLRSDQQSLASRFTGGGLVGRNLIQTERTRLSVFGGIAANRERYTVTASQPTGTNADAIAGIDFLTFRFSAAEVSSRFILYPSITTPGRVRAQLNSDLSIKLAKDLWWGLHLYENYDSKPPIKADKNDLGISASIGWKF